MKNRGTTGPTLSGVVDGFDFFSIVQLLAASGSRRVMRLQFGDQAGSLVFDRGGLVYASAGDVEGEDAFYRMARWTGAAFEVLAATKSSLQPNVQVPIAHLVMEAAREMDEEKETSAAQEGPSGPSDEVDAETLTADSVPPACAEGADRITLKEAQLMAIKDHLQEFSQIEGCRGVAVFTAQGEILDSVTTGKVDIKTIGMFANNALLNAQKATDSMGVGRGNLMQIRAPQAVVLMRCLNEATDFAASKDGKAHFHTVVVMDPEGNTGMASMLLDKVVSKIADEVR